MPQFEYKVINSEGKERRGTMFAATKEQASMRLKSDGLIISELLEASLKKKGGFRSRAIRPSDYGMFCRQFARILHAGLNPVNTLQVLAEQTENRQLKRGTAALADLTGAGDSLSFAMKKQGGIFPGLLICAVEEAEITGNLEKTFTYMAAQFESEEKLKEMTKKAFYYPALVAVVCLFVVVVMLLVVIPRFVGMFADIDFTMPYVTQVVIGISSFCVKCWPLFLAVLTGLFLVGRLYGLTARGRLFYSEIILETPFFGRLHKQLAYARFSRTLSALLYAGVSAQEALEETAGFMDYELFRRMLLSASEEIGKGMTLSKALGISELFSPMLVQMVSIGEEIGNLGEMLDGLADYYEEEAIRMAGRRQTCIEMLSVVFMALIVGVLIAALVQPMVLLYDLVSGM
ncbi:MAG: type II secretion system F family protein [Lachnospiraceae bacterium]